MLTEFGVLKFVQKFVLPWKKKSIQWIHIARTRCENEILWCRQGAKDWNRNSDHSGCLWYFFFQFHNSSENLMSLQYFLGPGNVFGWNSWQPTPVFLPGKSHGRRSLVGCSPWGCTESGTTEWLHFHFSIHALEKEMATHSSVLAWRIPGMGEPGELPSMGSHRVRHDWSDLAAAAAC